MPIGVHCNHCGADDAVVPVSDYEDDRFIYVCVDCGWWGSDPLRVDFRPNFEITTTLSSEQGRLLQFRRGGSRDHWGVVKELFVYCGSSDRMNRQGASHIDFSARAELRKWRSLGGKRASDAAQPYLVADGTLEECIRKFMTKPTASRHLYEIHTAPQTDIVSAVMSAEHIVELARLRDFL